MTKNIFFILSILIVASCSSVQDEKPVDPASIVSISLKFTDVSAGDFHGVGIKEDGTLWTWGTNGFGQLGFLGSQPLVYSIRQLGIDNNWKSVDAHQFYSVGLKNDGSIWSWGANYAGQLGIGNYLYNALPRKIGVDNDWKSVRCGGELTVGLKTDGSIWIWGKIIGSSSYINRNTPLKLGVENDWRQIAVGDDFFLAIKQNGSLFGYGQNLYGQVNKSPDIAGVTNLVQIGIETDWKECSAGIENSGAIKNDGTLWTWGRNQFGQIGNGTTSTSESTDITQVGTNNDWKSLSAGVWNYLAIKNDGTIWGWGTNSENTLGIGNQSQRNEPTRIGNDNDWKIISTGYTLTHCLKSNNELWGWGSFNSLGYTTYVNCIIPYKMVW